MSNKNDNYSHPKYEVDLNKNRELAEFVGFMLGDGTILKRKNHAYEVELSFSTDNKEILRRGEYLIEEVTGIEPFKTYYNEKSYVKLRVSSLSLVNSLENIGLKSGDKVENQVGVPGWIKGKKEYEISCLSGLVDTDGCVCQREGEYTYNVIKFKNKSYNLLEDFKKMCQNIGVKPSSGGEYAVQIASQEEVKKFLELVNPIKRKYAEWE